MKINAEGMIERMLHFAMFQSALKITENKLKKITEQYETKLEEVAALKQDPIADLRAKIAARKQ